ncbi:hypothetical protein M3Y95_01157100 [Aphelenchoides besseyi]|nr:hypothetical protein M3Y95_01157100 [Aphelenchoides besseyi]
MFRYHFLKTRAAWTRRQLTCYLCLIATLISIQLPVLVSDISFYMDSDFDYQQWWPHDTSHSVFIVRDYKRTPALKAFGLYRSILTFGTFFLTVVMAALSVRVARTQVVNMSKKTTEVLSQYTNTLITRLILFGCTSILPIAGLYVGMFFGTSSTTIDFIASFLMIWFPTSNITSSQRTPTVIRTDSD